MLKLATREWIQVLPFAMNEVGYEQQFELQVRPRLPFLQNEPALDGAEISFSEYVRARAAGDDTVIGLPIFLMRGFRHRCLITSRSSTVDVSELRGTRIGLTGWPDSGNVWTRALLDQLGVGIDDASWFVGPLSGGEPEYDRVRIPNPPANLSTLPTGHSLTGELLRGELDLILTPFMPEGFFSPESPYRHVMTDLRAQEEAFFSRYGYVPGMHLFGVRRELLDQPIADQLLSAFTRSRDLDQQRRLQLLDTSPWQAEDSLRDATLTGGRWMHHGLEVNAQMITDFQQALVQQRLLKAPVPHEVLFPYS